MSPSEGPAAGNTIITIIGTSLGSGSDITAVTVGGASVLSINQQSSSQVIVVTSSDGSKGTVDVVVVSTSKGTTRLDDGFTLNPGIAKFEFRSITIP